MRDENRPLEDNLENRKPAKRFISRRSFLSKTIALGAGTIGAGLLSQHPNRRSKRRSYHRETRHCFASQRRWSYSRPTFGSNTTNSAASRTTKSQAAVAIQPTRDALEVIEDEMEDYIHDNTDDEITHHQFLNAYLVSKGAAPANLDPFRTLMGSTATGVNPDLIGHRLTNLTQLTHRYQLVDPLSRRQP